MVGGQLMYLKIKELRLENGLTQQELAKAINTSNKNIWAYENGKAFPPPEVLISLANFLEVTIDELIGRDEITPEERAAGASETKKISITPIEDEMLYTFREIGRKHGEQAQRALITVAEKMI